MHLTEICVDESGEIYKCKTVLLINADTLNDETEHFTISMIVQVYYNM